MMKPKERMMNEADVVFSWISFQLPSHQTNSPLSGVTSRPSRSICTPGETVVDVPSPTLSSSSNQKPSLNGSSSRIGSFQSRRRSSLGNSPLDPGMIYWYSLKTRREPQKLITYSPHWHDQGPRLLPCCWAIRDLVASSHLSMQSWFSYPQSVRS